jgi:hypothetical protein
MELHLERTDSFFEGDQTAQALIRSISSQIDAMQDAGYELSAEAGWTLGYIVGAARLRIAFEANDESDRVAQGVENIARFASALQQQTEHVLGISPTGRPEVDVSGLEAVAISLCPGLWPIC